MNRGIWRGRGKDGDLWGRGGGDIFAGLWVLGGKKKFAILYFPDGFLIFFFPRVYFDLR